MEQITEDYVSYEIAQLLKEKGFNENCHALYDVNTKQIDIKNVGDVFNNKQLGNYISAPTQSLALKWLMEVHKIRIHISPLTTFGDKWTVDVITPNKHGVVGNGSQFFPMYNDKYKNTDWWTEFDTYEEAVEYALLWSLKNLI